VSLLTQPDQEVIAAAQSKVKGFLNAYMMNEATTLDTVMI
jgi:hypothetical protein